MDAVQAPRETSGATTRLVVGYVREELGEAGVEELLRRSRLRRSVAELEDESAWSSYDERIALFEAAVDAAGGPDTMFQVGASALRLSLNPSLILLFRALGSPRQVFRNLPRAVPKFSSTSTMEVLESGPTHATIRYRLHDGYDHSRLDCRYTQGLFSGVPAIFGLPAARIVHGECQSDGHEACIYHVTWARYSRWRLRGRRGASGGTTAADAPELIALRAQLEALQSAAADLVSSEDLDTVLARITQRAAAAVLAQGYVLAVEGPAGESIVRFSGVAPHRAHRLADALRRGVDVGPSAVAVDVASTRRHHGHLAAIYADGQRGFADEERLLGAYAGHAAAALDLLLALDESRRGQRTAQSLLALAHDLARAGTPERVVEVAGAAIPEITGAGGARVLLEAELGDTGWSRGPQLLPSEELPEHLAEHACPGGLAGVAPLEADDRLLGLVVACWGPDAPPEAEETALAALNGVADQTGTALQNAHLVAAIRHQSLHDELTGLPNRVHFSERLQAALAGARGRVQPVGVLFCDLDGFKAVNDSQGHGAGDAVLREVAMRLRGAVRADDVVARLSGDEFAVLLPAVTSAADAVRVGEGIVSACEAPFVVEGEPLRVTVSVGVTVGSGGDDTAGGLLRDADAAMYEAKQAGRACVRLADAASSGSAQLR